MALYLRSVISVALYLSVILKQSKIQRRMCNLINIFYLTGEISQQAA